MEFAHNLIGVAKLLLLVIIAAKLFKFARRKLARAAVAIGLGAAQAIAPRREKGPFDLSFPLLKLSPFDDFTVGNAVENLHVFGGNGSGKTSGPGRAFTMAYLRAGMGFLVMTAKPGEAEMITRYAAEVGRAKDVIRFAPEERYRFNFLAYLQKLPSRGGGITSNIVSTLVTIQEALEKGNETGTREQYWKDTLNQLLRNAVDLCLLARPHENLSIERLHEVVTSAPISAAQVDDGGWQAGSLSYRLLDEALQNEALTQRQRSDLKLTGKYWLTEFACLPNDTRASIVSTFTSMVDGFLRGVFADLFVTSLNVVPEMTFNGAIIILDLPAKLFGKVGLAAQAVWKHLWEDAVERRDFSKNRRPVCLLADEWHLFITDHD